MMDRDKLIAKVRALTAKTSAAGCTEAEAMAAAEKAAELMRAHGISEDVLETSKASIAVKQNLKSNRARLWAGISHCTNCASILSGVSSSKTLIYVGVEPGPEIACYIHDVTNRAIDAAVAEFRKGAFYKARRSTKTKRLAVQDFEAGMVSRLINQLRDMFESSVSPVKAERARSARDQFFPGAKSVARKEQKTRFEEAAYSGYAAGSKVNLKHGVSTSGARLAITAGAK